MKNSLSFVITFLFSLSLFLTSFVYFQDTPWVVPESFINKENPFSEEGDVDGIGEDLYAVHCKSCHGKKGLGDGSKSKELNTAVPDMTSDSFKNQTDGEIYFKLIIGRNEMPGFSKKIGEEEDRWLLINYLREL